MNNKPLTALIAKLTYGSTLRSKRDNPNGLIETIAGVYEKARNALEYRADNLVRRAAIERILKRRIILNKNPKSVTESLVKELRWARYLSIDEVGSDKKAKLEKIITKYIDYLGGKAPQEWVIKIASAEIEELFNLNTDYKQFTYFAFQVLRQKIELNDPNIDLLVYYAVDKTYAESDDEKSAYHILGLAGTDVSREKFEEAWDLFNYAKRNNKVAQIVKYVRREMPPLILLRDVYFSDPAKFKEIISSPEKYKEFSAEVLNGQIGRLTSRINTAGFRSVLYVFLTKMILAFGMEVPFEIFFYGTVDRIPLAINLLFPPFIMWASTVQIKLPNQKSREILVERSWDILENFENLKNEDNNLKRKDEEAPKNLLYYIFYSLYIAFFVAVFGGIIFILNEIGYTLFSELIFLFFLTVIAFFAYRISQIAKIYSWTKTPSRPNVLEIVSIPILTIGSRLSRGLTHLNFLAFTFDFILEAPFKLILGFFDDWVQFLSVRKDEQIIE